MLRKTLLVCGILSSMLYAAMTVVIAMQWEGYSSTSQTISELSAIGAPTRPVWVRLGAVYTVLVTAFGWGIWRSAGRNRALRIVGSFILAYGLLGALSRRRRLTRERRAVGEADVERDAILPRNRSRDMALASGVFSEQDAAGAQADLLAVFELDLALPGQRHH